MVSSEEPDRIKRRQLLAAIPVVTTAGCSNLLGTDPTRHPDGSTPRKTQTPRTESELSVFWQGTDVWKEEMEEEIIPKFTNSFDAEVDARYKVGHRPRWFNFIDNKFRDGDPPELYHGRLPSLAKYLAKGQLQPVDDIVEDLAATNGELMVESPISVQNSTYLVPLEISPGGILHYRTDIYEELELSVPETWDELLENSRAIEEADSIDASGFAVGASEKVVADQEFTSWFYSAGGTYFRWTDESANELTVDFRDEHVRPALEMMQELAEYSPAPADVNRSDVVSDWVDGALAQCLFQGMALPEFAYQRGEEHVARTTRQALPPLRNRDVEPLGRGWVDVVGAVIFEGSNRELAEKFLRVMVGDPERQAKVNDVPPGLWAIPPYRDVIETDVYQDGDIFRALDGHFFDLVRYSMDEIVPHIAGDRPRNAGAMYARQGEVIVDLVHAVVAEGKPLDDEIRRARERLRARLEEGRELG